MDQLRGEGDRLPGHGAGRDKGESSKPNAFPARSLVRPARTYPEPI